jgi:hypothetical protein
MADTQGFGYSIGRNAIPAIKSGATSFLDYLYDNSVNASNQLVHGAGYAADKILDGPSVLPWGTVLRPTLDGMNDFGEGLSHGFYEYNNPTDYAKMPADMKVQVQDNFKRHAMEAAEAAKTPAPATIPSGASTFPARPEFQGDNTFKKAEPVVNATANLPPELVTAQTAASPPDYFANMPAGFKGPSSAADMTSGLAGFNDILKGVRGDDPYGKIEGYWNKQAEEAAPSDKYSWDDLARFGAAWGGKGGTPGDALLAVMDYKDKQGQQFKDNQLQAMRGLTDVQTARQAAKMADFQTSATLYNTMIQNGFKSSDDEFQRWNAETGYKVASDNNAAKLASDAASDANRANLEIWKAGNEDKRAVARDAADIAKAEKIQLIKNKGAAEIQQIKNGGKTAVPGLGDKDFKEFQDELAPKLEAYKASTEYQTMALQDPAAALRKLDEVSVALSKRQEGMPKWQARIARSGGADTSNAGVTSSDDVSDEE